MKVGDRVIITGVSYSIDLDYYQEGDYGEIVDSSNIHLKALPNEVCGVKFKRVLNPIGSFGDRCWYVAYRDLLVCDDMPWEQVKVLADIVRNNHGN